MVNIIKHDGNISIVEHDRKLCVLSLSPEEGMKAIIPFDSLYFDDEIHQIYDNLTVEEHKDESQYLGE